MKREELEQVTGGFQFRNLPGRKKQPEPGPKYDLTYLNVPPIVLEPQREPAIREPEDPPEALAYENNVL